MRINYNLIGKNPSRYALMVLMLFVSACSQTTTKNTAEILHSPSAINEENKDKVKDPYEAFNRGIYNINSDFDKSLLKTFAKAYITITPEVVDDSITNFFLNIEDIATAFNNLLQLKPVKAFDDSKRVLVNTTLGIGGLFDAATPMGIEKHDEDFGQTLAFWGVPSGPYVMFPVLGPSTLRDATAKLTVDRLTNLTSYSDKSIYFFVTKNLDKRADLLSTEEAFKDISDDPYIAVREAWLQRRDYLLRDGEIDEQSETDLIDELEALDDE